MIFGLGPAELKDLLQRLRATRMPLDGLLERPAPPSSRRPRRTGVVTYRVRVDLDGTKPPLWRRLELASDLFLDQVHEIMQVAFGWTDSHLHQFGSGPGHYDPRTEHYLCPFQVEEGDPGVPEDDVRLDEVLAEPGDKLHAIRTPTGRRELRRLLASAQLDQPALVDAATAARMAGPYAWLLDRVGDDGIKLTSAGYLPPPHVEAAVAELGLEEEWIGKGNRENQTLPVLHLRESATAMGLLRKRNGMLLLTSRARALRTDPPVLWRHLAQRMPPRPGTALR